MKQQRKQEIAQLVEACEVTDNTPIEAEKTGVIAELLAEVEQNDFLETVVETDGQSDYESEVEIEPTRAIDWEIAREIEMEIQSQIDLGYRPEVPEVEFDY